MTSPRWTAVLLDIDGVLHVGEEPTPGAAAVLAQLESAGIPYRLVTNTTSRPRSAILERLDRLGFSVDPEHLLTPATLAVARCEAEGYERVALLVSDALREDLGPLVAREQTTGSVDALVIGDLGERFDYAVLNGAFRQLLEGGDLIALQANRVWQDTDGPRLDAGPFVAALEYALEREATVVGKPAGPFFAAALAALGADAGDTLMVGDDLEADVGGALSAGLGGVLVRTGKFRQTALDASTITPTEVIDGVADLPALLGLG